MSKTIELDEMIGELPTEVQGKVFEIKDETRDETVRDILTDLEDWTSEFTGEQLAGMRAAIEIIKTNYRH